MVYAKHVPKPVCVAHQFQLSFCYMCHAPIPWAPMTAARASRKTGHEIPCGFHPLPTVFKGFFVWAQSLGPTFLPALVAIIGAKGTGTCH